MSIRRNDDGQLGTGDTNDVDSPIPVKFSIPSSADIKKIECGGYHTFILTKDNKLYAFGYNRYGQLGNGKNDVDNPNPIFIKFRLKFVNIFACCYHSILVCSDGEYYGIGYNNIGQLGIGSKKSQNTPQKILIPKNIKIIDVKGGCEYTLFLCSSGELYKTGNVYSVKECHIPILLSTKLVEKNDKIITISCGVYHFLCISSRGNVFSMGTNNAGQLGLGTTDDSKEIVFVKLLENERISSISCGGHYSIVLIANNNEIISFGYGKNGQLGLETKKEKNPIPKKVISLKNVEQIYAGNKHTYAITKDGELYCCGSNDCYQFGMKSPKKSAKFILNKDVKILRKTIVKLWIFDPFKCKKAIDVIFNCVYV